MVRFHIISVWPVLDVIGNSNRIQSLFSSLFNPDGGPNIAIGEHCVDMEITLQG